MMRVAVLVVLLACGDNGGRDPVDLDAGPTDAPLDAPEGDLFGEPCEQPPFPVVGLCHGEKGACHDEPGGSVCRPYCTVAGGCEAIGGVEIIDDRGSCLCVPP